MYLLTVFFELFLILQNSAAVDEPLTAGGDADHFFNFILKVLNSFLEEFLIIRSYYSVGQAPINPVMCLLNLHLQLY